MESESPEMLFARGLAQARIGRDEEARADFLAALPTLGDAVRIELALLDLHRLGAAEVQTTAAEIAAKAPEPSLLRARALHVLGLAQGHLRNPAATDALLKSGDIYRALGERLKRAEVYDTLGMLHESRGRVDYAMNFFAISLTDKSLAGDRHGMAITLGNMGRAHLREGRFRDALDCFERDAELSEQLGDLRGIARTLQDIGRARAAMGETEPAQESLLKSLSIARQSGHSDLVFFAHKELALLNAAQHRFEDAEYHLAAAESALPPDAEAPFQMMLIAARGNLLDARGDPTAIDLLERAVEGFAQADLPDLEIPTRIALARALLKKGLKATAETCLTEGLRRTRAEGYSRYLSPLRQAMTELDLVEGAVEEEYRPLHDGPAPPPGSYVMRQRLGSGAFGEVFRAFDLQRDQDVALKRLHLNQLYDNRQRDQLIGSAHLELEAASRVQHPGVVKVLAIGTEPDGDLYIVQEFVPGQSLRALMTPSRQTPTADVLRCLGQVASALDALHRRNVVHRDIKPENILIRDNGSPVLVDFGVAHINRFDRLGKDVLVGTLEYLAPEQARGKTIDGRADLYSLGVIAFEWLAGCRPLRLRGETIDAMIGDLIARPAPPLTDFRPDLAGEVNDLIMRLLAKQPRKRVASAADLAQACKELQPRSN